MTTKSLGPGFKVSGGKVTKRPPRMAPVLASAKHKQAARIEKRLRENAAKSKGDP